MKRPKKGAAEEPHVPTFTGKLAEPVNGMKLTAAMLRATGPEGQVAIDEANAEMWVECLNKVPLLAAHYSIEWNETAPDWGRLALAMALDLVPGFRFKFPEMQAPPKAGRPSERNWVSFYYRADRLMVQGMNLTDACRQLSVSDPDFQGLKVTTLVSKFNEKKRSLLKAASEAIMRESTEDKKPTDMQKPN